MEQTPVWRKYATAMNFRYCPVYPFFGVLGCGRDMYVYMTIPLSQVFNWHGHITGGKDVNLETKSTVYKLYF